MEVLNMKKDDIFKKKIVKLPKHHFMDPNGAIRDWNFRDKKSTSSLTKERKVATSGFSSRGETKENEDKNIPLMEPTIFDENDPNNPKYVSLEEKKENLELKKLQKQTTYSVYRSRAMFALIPSMTVGLFFFAWVITNYGSALSDINLILSAIPFTVVMSAPTLIISSIGYKKSKKMDKVINDLEKEIEEDIKIKNQKEKNKIKEKVKSLPEETKKILNDISKDKELNDVKKAFGMSYEEFLKLYESTNGFQDEENFDIALSEFCEESDFLTKEEQSKSLRTRYKIKGRKIGKEQQ